MILLEDKLISEDIIEKSFACDILKCKGNCCVKGDAGAPLEPEEVNTIQNNLSAIEPFIDPKGVEFIRANGFSETRDEQIETACLPSGDCVFVQYQNGIATCGIEHANASHGFGFKKPVSCHLYPIRVSQVGDYTALNYHQWDICNDACEKGNRLQMPIYKFSKEALSRAFGTEFYDLLSNYAQFVHGNEK
jgi:hypothetical protein